MESLSLLADSLKEAALSPQDIIIGASMAVSGSDSAVRADAAWVAMARDLRHAYPDLRFGAASVCTAEALQAVVEARLAYAVSPMLDPALLEQARAAAITLVPGVFTPTEVALAV